VVPAQVEELLAGLPGHQEQVPLALAHVEHVHLDARAGPEGHVEELALVVPAHVEGDGQVAVESAAPGRRPDAQPRPHARELLLQKCAVHGRLRITRSRGLGDLTRPILLTRAFSRWFAAIALLLPSSSPSAAVGAHFAVNSW